MGDSNDLNMGFFNSDDVELNLDTDFEEIQSNVEDDKGIEDEVPAGTEENPDVVDPEKNEISEEDGDPLNPDIVAKGENEEGDEGTKSSPNIYNSLASVLHERGVLPSFKEEDLKIDDVDSLINAFKSEIKSNEYSDLSEVQKEYLTAIRDGVPSEEFLSFKQKENNIGSITKENIEEDVELRKQILFQDYINSGVSQEKAIKFVDMSVNNGTDFEDAVEALPSVKEYDKMVFETRQKDILEQREKKEKEVVNRDNELKELIINEKLFTDFNPSQGVRESAKKSMTTIISENEGSPENKLMKYRRENPIEFDAKLYLLFELTNGFKDFSKVENTSSSSAVKDLERTLRHSNFIEKGGQPIYSQDANSYSGVGDELAID